MTVSLVGWFLSVMALRIEPDNQCVVCCVVIGSIVSYHGSIPF